MHFHLPKPLHGWREFVGEVGIIVIGVLIALAAEQIVTNWHWRREVRETDRRLREDPRCALTILAAIAIAIVLGGASGPTAPEGARWRTESHWSYCTHLLCPMNWMIVITKMMTNSTHATAEARPSL